MRSIATLPRSTGSLVVSEAQSLDSRRSAARGARASASRCSRSPAARLTCRERWSPGDALADSICASPPPTFFPAPSPTSDALGRPRRAAPARPPPPVAPPAPPRPWVAPSVDHLPIRDGAVDYVTCGLFFHHLTDAQ